MGDDLIYAKGVFGICVNEEINWDTETLVSWSQFSKYRKCPKSWELRYVRSEKFEDPSIYFAYGTAMHETIQTYIKQCFLVTVKSANEMNLHQIFLDAFKSEYKLAVERYGKHFSSKEELATFYHDGCQILDFVKRKRSLYFSRKGIQLVGIELPILKKPNADVDNVKLTAHLDLVFFDKRDGTYIIIDIKTAKNGWNKWKRKDKNVTDQLILYKSHFCEKFNIPPEKVKIEYFILRQKIDPDSLWPIKRVSQFSPASGKVSMNRVRKDFDEFIAESFTKDGKYRDISHPAIAGKNFYNCRFCIYNDKENLCPVDNRITEIH